VSADTGISWTQATWNPVTGCDRISRGCDHCYALTLAKRLKAMGSAKYQNDGDPRTSGPGFGVTIHPDALNIPRKWRDPKVVFVNSMSDLFHAKVPLSFVHDVFAVIAETPRHTYQVLTKRASRLPRIADKLDWPPNLWMGVTVEDADHVNRIDYLRSVPAAVRFLSCEPLLSPLGRLDLTGIGWVIAGGESGKGARPMDLDWPRSVRDQCVRICGTGLGLPVRRHRLFESNLPLIGVPCEHGRFTEPRYWTGWRPNGEHRLSTVVQVYGNAGGKHEWPAAMGIDWASYDEIAEAVPPAYTEFIGEQLIAHLRERVA
jgi:protein gp37